MPYTEAHLRMLNTQPGTIARYETITLKNDIAGELNLLVSGVNGPYKAMNFIDDGVVKLFTPVRANVPNTSDQDVSSNVVCRVQIGSVSSQAFEYIMSIIEGSVKPFDKLITARLAVYESSGGDPIFARNLYVGADGISMSQTDVELTLEIDNPAKSQYAPFYNPTEYFSLIPG
jgi:hypothetical protein